MSASVEQARKALGARLREVRKDANLTARAFAASAGWHYTKVSKLENGARTPSQADIRHWCRICGAEDQVPDLIAAARDVESMYAEWRRQLRAGMRRSQAARLPLYERTRLFRFYEPALVPGILQTAQYAAAVIGSFLAFTQAATDLNEAVAARMEWQRIIYGDHEFQVVLEEQALRTRVGDAGTMTGQLDRLLAVMSLPGVELSVIPVSAPRKVMPSGGFLIFDDEMVQAETVSAELTVTQPQEIALYVRRFSFLRQSAVSGRDARNLIHRAIAAIAELSLPTSVNIVVGLARISVASLLRPAVPSNGGPGTYLREERGDGGRARPAVRQAADLLSRCGRKVMVMPSLKELSTDELREAGSLVETVIDFRDYLPPGGKLLMEMGKLRDNIRDLLQVPPFGHVHREPGCKPLNGLEDAELCRLTDAVLILIAEFPGYLDSPDTLRHLIDVLGGLALEKQARAFAEEFTPESGTRVWAKISEEIRAS